MIQVKGRQIPVSKKKEEPKRDHVALTQRDLEKLKGGHKHGNKYQELMQGKLAHWSVSRESGGQSEEEGREVMVRDQGIGVTPF